MARLTLIIGVLLGLCPVSTKADQARDYLIQKVCVDEKGNVLLADPFDPPAGSHLRNLQVGEPLPYNKHDQPSRGHPEGYQRHDSYPVLDKDGRELSLNPFYYGEDNPGNGYDIYCLRDGWASATSSRDGDGFSSTFFGEAQGQVVPYNGWLFFPESFITGGYLAGSIKKPIAGRYWELNGEPWPGVQPAGFLAHAFSETSWQLIKGCLFGGMAGNTPKQMDAILSVHGYISKGTPPYDSNMAHGHLEVFYFTRLYGVTRWEVWTPMGQLGDSNRPSELRAKAIRAARFAGRPICEAGESYIQPKDLPSTAANQFIAATFTGEDGLQNSYAVTDVRDWSAVTVLPAPEPPAPCPIPEQNLLANFHFDRGTFSPWQKTGPITWDLRQSQTTPDTRFGRKIGDTGVRYLVIQSQAGAPSDQGIYQDISVKNMTENTVMLSVRARSENEGGVLRMLLQQVDAHGKVLSTEIDSTKTVNPTNRIYSYDGIHDPNPHASVVLSSHILTCTGRWKPNPATSFLRFSIQTESSGEFDLIDANVSLTPDDQRPNL